jgi:uncharacterized protein
MKQFALALSCLLLFSGAAIADDTDTFKGLMALAERGDAEAQYHVGMFYNNGIGTAQDTRQAFAWFEKSAVKDPLGAYKLGCYYAGQGAGVVAADAALALKYKLVAAEAGYSLAQYDVGAEYARLGKFDEAFKWIKQSAEQGYDQALYALSSMYFASPGVPEDLGLALAYLELNVRTSKQFTDANQGLIDAFKANMTEDERAKAAKVIADWKPKPTWLTLEAEQGVTAAEEHLKTAVK